MAFTLAAEATTLPVEVVKDSAVAMEGTEAGSDCATPGPLLPDGTHFGSAYKPGGPMPRLPQLSSPALATRPPRQTWNHSYARLQPFFVSSTVKAAFSQTLQRLSLFSIRRQYF
ncbi:hypothetical protein P389DRAFT_176465 [Cystobasidium minutum MCA 4210]|uniref:uncharacterized protein n=1 Tax=Cystobasidium minutum MCA 4210 TaxID=1397322 RepID=UPI0034CF72D5|eukprot:jgi/Rhomi1/176465/fgenesh1_kg.23_\